MDDAPPPVIRSRATAWTTYWSTDRARRGLIYCRYQHRMVFMLVPPVLEHHGLFESLPPMGTPAEIWPDLVDGKLVYRFLWFTETQPYFPRQVLVHAEQWGTAPPIEAFGLVVPLIWYAAAGDDGAVIRRREEVQIGRNRLA